MPDLRDVPLSVLDIVPVHSGQSVGEALRETLALARHVEALGYRRHWFAEHHAMPSIASAAPALLVGQVAAATRTIRVGAGGVMLPNHAPLVVAEQFGTLEALFPGRIDLGLGRAPGTDPQTMRALRRHDAAVDDDFPDQLAELLGFFRGDFPVDHPYHRIAAVPARGHEPPVWLLGSSGYSAHLAGVLGLPFAFAHHFSQQNTLPALALYRDRFRPSAARATPHAMVGVAVIVAEDDATAQRLARPAALAFLRLRQGRLGPFPSLADAEAHPWSPAEREFLADWLAINVVGGPASVRAQLERLLAATRADELMVLTAIPDHEARLRSYTLLRELQA
jgi:luciferase family oxidoreductase group 1